MKSKALVTIALATLGAGCSGIQTTHDFNPDVSFAELRTYDWMPQPTSGGRDSRVDNDLVDARFRRAIETVMEESGMQKVTSGEPDFRVGYFLALDDQVDYQTVNSYWGSSWGYGMYGYRGAGMTMSTSTVQERRYTVGTMIIDIFDVESHELVWRGSGEGKVNQNARDPQERQERADEAVRAILKQFPPKS
jgi:Domain of unknown function (DUF4136)